MAAIAYLDRINGTSIVESYLPMWEAFVADKPIQSLNEYINDFEIQIDAVKQVAEKS
ncbi:MAG: hypothetical protein JXD22_02010 [Sedimentisphaerales bacterium]|nr:hypothetical protein [Sedimentisphaerales bacterium]